MIDTVPKTPNLTIRIPPEVLEQIQALAESETRSVNGQIVQLLKEALAARGHR
jgi:hypothetical protein